MIRRGLGGVIALAAFFLCTSCWTLASASEQAPGFERTRLSRSVVDQRYLYLFDFTFRNPLPEPIEIVSVTGYDGEGHRVKQDWEISGRNWDTRIMTHALSGDHPLVKQFSKPRGMPLEKAIIYPVGEDRIKIKDVNRVMVAHEVVQSGIYIISARKKYDALTLRVVYKRSGKKEEAHGVFGLDPRENEPVGPGRDQVARDIEQMPSLSTGSAGCRCPTKGRIRVRSVEVVEGEHAGTPSTNSYEISFRAAVEGLSDLKLEERGSATSPSCPTHFCGEECANRPADPRCAQRQALANLLSNFEAPDAREREPAVPPNILSGRTYVLEAKLKYTADQQGRWSAQSYQAASISPVAHWTAPDRIGNAREANEQPAMPDDEAMRPRFACLGGRPGEQCDQPPELVRRPMSEKELEEQRAQMEVFNDLVACVTGRPGAKVDPEYLKYADAFFAIKEGRWYGLIPGAACVKLGGEIGPLMDLAAFEARHIRDIVQSIYGISVQVVCDNSGQIESTDMARLVCGHVAE